MLTTDWQTLVLRRIAEVMSDGEPGVLPVAVAMEATLTGDLGLQSIQLAELVAILEQDLKVDPFAALVPITSVRTVGDLCEAYRRGLAGEQPSTEADADVMAARQRAQARRRQRG